MAKLPRKTQKIFASGASNNGVFGSAADNTKILSNDLATIQSKAAYESGWDTAVIGDKKFPPLEEFQSLQYMWSTQLAYMFENGIPEYDAGTTYYVYSIVRKTGTYELYGSKTNNNLGNDLTDDTEWEFLVDLSLEQSIPYGVSTGSANTYAVTTSPVFDSLVDGKPFIVKWNADNTGDATLNPNSINALQILSGGVALTGGELKAGGMYIFIQDNTNTKAHLINPSPIAASTTRNGTVEIATPAEIIAQTDQLRVATPYNINQLFSASGRQSIATNGYQILPAGLVLQWGIETASISDIINITFPKTYDNSCLSLTFSQIGDGGSVVGGYIDSYNNSGAVLKKVSTQAFWWSIGY